MVCGYLNQQWHFPDVTAENRRIWTLYFWPFSTNVAPTKPWTRIVWYGIIVHLAIEHWINAKYSSWGWLRSGEFTRWLVRINRPESNSSWSFVIHIFWKSAHMTGKNGQVVIDPCIKVTLLQKENLCLIPLSRMSRWHDEIYEYNTRITKLELLLTFLAISTFSWPFYSRSLSKWY